MPDDRQTLLAKQAEARRLKAQQTEERSTLRTIMDLLGRPGGAVAGGFRAVTDPSRANEPVWAKALRAGQRSWQNLTGDEEDRFVDVLDNVGMDPGMGRSALGLGLDLVADPLNLVPAGPILKGAKALGGAVRHGASYIKPLDTALTATTNALGKTFVPYYGLDEAYAPIRRKFDVESRQINRQTADEVYKDFAGTTKSNRTDLAHAMDEGRPIADPKLLATQTKYTDELARQFADEGRVGLQDFNNEIANYFPRVFRDKFGHAMPSGGGVQGRVNSKMPFAKQRKTDTLADAIALGADPDAATALLTRLAKGRTAVRNADFLTDTFRKFGEDVSSGAMPGFRKPGHGTLADKPFWQEEVILPSGQVVKMKDLALPESIADDITHMFGNAERNPVTDWIGRQTSKWRGLATIYRPDIAFEMTNLQGNMWNAGLGGQKWAIPKHIAKIWDPTPKAVPGMSADEVAEAVNRLGISNAQNMGVGEITNSEGMARQLDKALETTPEWARRLFVPEKGNLLKTAHRPLTGLPRAALGGFANAKRALNTRIEGASKLSFFEDALRKTDQTLPPDERTWKAYEQTAESLFDYGELTRAEQNIRNVGVPFYTFMRKNIPLQVKGLATRPQQTAGLEKIFESLENRTEERGELEPMGFRPKWMQEGPVTQIPSVFSGMKIPGTDIQLSPDPVPGSSQWYNAYLPIQDLNKIPMPGGSSTFDVARDFASSINPVVKTGLEWASGQSMFTGLPLWDKQLGGQQDIRRAPFPLNKMPTDWLDALPGVEAATVKNYQKQPEVQTSAALNMIWNNLMPLSSTAGRTLDTLTGTGLPSQAFAPWTSALGIRINPRTPDQMKQGRQDALSTLKGQKTKLRKQEDLGGNTFSDKLRFMFGGQ